MTLPLVGGCVKDIVVKEKRLWADGLVKVRLKKAENKDGSGIVFGELSIVGTSRRIQSVDLNCVGLAISGLSSERLYVDSIAHVLTDKFLAKGGQIHVSVYWLFKEPIQTTEFSRVEIVLNKNRDQRQPCIDWTDQ